MLRAAAVAALIALAEPAPAQPVVLSATFVNPVTRYGHNALGPGHEWAALELTLLPGPALTGSPCTDCTPPGTTVVRFVLPANQVFEDTQPRLADLDGDDLSEVIVVQSDLQRGSQLAVYGPGGLIAATARIGQRYRWLAPIGAADFDGDGRVEIAYVQTPHLRPVLKFVTLRRGRLTVLASAPGLPNHHIGSDKIEAAILPCGNHALILTGNADWTAVMATRFDRGALTSKAVGRYTGAQSIANLPGCS